MLAQVYRHSYVKLKRLANNREHFITLSLRQVPFELRSEGICSLNRLPSEWVASAEALQSD